MNTNLYHARRLVVSCLFECMLRVISWAVSVRKQHYIVLYFAAACVVCGIAFTVCPSTMAAFFDFQQLSIVSLTDVRSYYGTMLVCLGLALAYLAKTDDGAKAAIIIIAAFSLGSAAGRLIGFTTGAPLLSVHGLLAPIEIGLGILCIVILRKKPRIKTQPLPVLDPKTPEEFNPLSTQNFRNPYAYYKMLRDDYPLYYMKSQRFYMLSRYEDITEFTKDTELMSNKLVEILASGKPKDPERTTLTATERLGNWGILPVDVLALQDPPIHTAERKVGHKGFNSRFIKSLEPEVEMLCDEMMDEFLPRGNVEFVQDFAWRLPMRLIIRLLGFPEEDFEDIKQWCVDGIKSLSGTATKAEQIAIGASAAQFMRYLWRQYLLIKKTMPDNFTANLAKMADDPDNIMTDQRVVATLLQLLIAGSDSSASSMGSAIRVLAENPDLEQRLRHNPDDIPNFIEEVFRTESAFQGHFRLTKHECEIHGVKLPAATRVFMMWGSGNRDERFWNNPDEFDMDREHVKKHLTFGHGIHACIGRELARMEIRIVIAKLLERTEKIEIVGEAPYEASIFARTLVSMPLAFKLREEPVKEQKVKEMSIA